MCYAKPGPRCSGHAAILLQKAKANLESDAKDRTWEKVCALREAVDEAQQIFDSTPAGLKILEDEIDVARSHGSKPYELQLRHVMGTEIREKQLAAVAAMKLQQEKHSFGTKQITPASNFLGADVPRAKASNTNLATAESSREWLYGLKTEELAQLRWMTDYGTWKANTHLAGVQTYKNVSATDDINERMKNVDSGLAKYQSSNPTITYRGVREGLLPKRLQGNYRVSNEDKTAAFLDSFPKEGEVFESSYYMPTSFQPDVAASKFADFDVVLEIKSRSAAPLGVISAADYEEEGLLPRNSKYRVAAVLQDVSYPYDKRMTVIQLEEITS